MSERGVEELIVLNNKLTELFKRYEDLRTDNKELKDENDTLKSHLDERNEKLRELEIRYERIRITGALMGEGEGAVEAKKKINELVREIDRCIALLNR
jgi:predicted nuclease with TOPRIM domain